MRMLKNKKGFVAEYIIDIWAYIIWVLVILLFLIITNVLFNPLSAEITSLDLRQADLDRMVISFLEMPITYDSQKLTMQELIVLADVNDNNDAYLTISKEAYEMFSDPASEKQFWGMSITGGKQTNKVYGLPDNCRYLAKHTEAGEVKWSKSDFFYPVEDKTLKYSIEVCKCQKC